MKDGLNLTPKPELAPGMLPRNALMALMTVALMALSMAWVTEAVASTREKTASYEGTAAAGKWSGIEFRRMNRGAEFRVTGVTEGMVRVMMLDAGAMQPSPDPELAMSNKVTDGSFALSFTVPKDGDYYLVIDNRTGTIPVAYRFSARVTLTQDQA